MAIEAKIDKTRFTEWLKVAYFVYEQEQTRDGLKQFCIMRGGFKVLFNGRKLYQGGDLSEAITAYDNAFADYKLKADTPITKKKEKN